MRKVTLYSRPEEEWKSWSKVFQRFASQLSIAEANKKKASIIGVGSVGSFCAFTLAKMGIVDLTLVDMDTVEIHNAGNQIYGFQDVGKPKVEALKDILSSQTLAKNIKSVFGPYEIEDVSEADIVVCAVDCMETRAIIASDVHDLGVSNLFMDTRIGGGQVEVILLDPSDPSVIEEYLKGTQNPTTKEVCTDIGGIGPPMLAGAFLSSAVIRHVRGIDASGHLLGMVKHVFELAVVKGYSTKELHQRTVGIT